MASLHLQQRRGTRTDAVAADVLPLDLPGAGLVHVLHVRNPRARRLRLSVDDRGPRLTTPVRGSRAQALAFLGQHAAWLDGQLARLADAGGAPLQRDLTATLPLRGSDVAVQWQAGRVTRLLDAPGGLVFQAHGDAGPAALGAALRAYYEAQARADIGRWLPSYLPGLPQPPRRIALKRPTSLWGSLAADAGMTLDLALVLARPTAFEYVLVHELCHLLHRDHSPRFWAAVEARFPAWRQERAYLRADGPALKSRLRRLLAG